MCLGVPSPKISSTSTNLYTYQDKGVQLVESRFLHLSRYMHVQPYLCYVPRRSTSSCLRMPRWLVLQAEESTPEVCQNGLHWTHAVTCYRLYTFFSLCIYRIIIIVCMYNYCGWQVNASSLPSCASAFRPPPKQRMSYALCYFPAAGTILRRDFPCANIKSGKYKYIYDLQTLAAGSSLVEDYTKWPRYTSPINLVRLEPFLRAHPDQCYASYMHKSIHEGFRIGFHGPWDHLRSYTSNHPSPTVTPQGRTFLRSLFSILSRTLQPHHHMRLNRCTRGDLAWWNTFLQGWNGKSFFPGAKTTLEVTSDASGSYGCGAIFGNTWFQAPSWEAISITAKELVPIVIATAFWGSQWTKSRVHFFCDNMAVVALLKTLTSKDALIMHLLRCLAFYAAHYGLEIESYHIPGVQNVAADAISRTIWLLSHLSFH